LVVRGAAQGVGFRPFVFRLAAEHRLMGWVQNSPQGARLEVEGCLGHLESFLEQFHRDARRLGCIHSIETTYLDPAGYTEFEIRRSTSDGPRCTWIMPDLATCPECLRELFDPHDRRYRYPFLNCTQCGPRFSIIEQLPYDRPNTAMRHFPLCPECEREYHDARDRRFHAQPIACPRCGPGLEWCSGTGRVLASGDVALRQCAQAIRAGAIVALKGLGGFQLLVDARNEEAVKRLRARKQREEKPFALMYPSCDAAGIDTVITPQQAQSLASPQAPIVLVRKRSSTNIAASVAPGNPFFGVMIPYTPLHHLLLADLNGPIVATSGNRSDEPIAIDGREALARLADIADLFLTHNRPIARPMDDSVVRVMLGREQILRRARGYAPLPITVDRPLPFLLAVGGHLKNVVAVSVGGDVFLSQHVGDLETAESARVFEQATCDLPRLYDVSPRKIACDMHPDYHSTRFAERLASSGLPVVPVQHHVAHVLACMAEHGIQSPVLGVAWDGAGFGTDGTIWGGEFLHVTSCGVCRVAHLRPFRLPGGDRAAREPRRAALGLLHAWLGDDLFTREDIPLLNAFKPGEWALLSQALACGLNAPFTSSVGRLFDAAAALAGVRLHNRFEGQAAMEWEWCAQNHGPASPYPVAIVRADAAQPIVVDWGPLLEVMQADLQAGIEPGAVSARFHAGLIEAIIAVCRLIGEPRVALTGGCFLNRLLLESAVRRLTSEGFTPYWHQRVPPGDGGIALGQIMAAADLERFHVPGDPRQSH
jgi:hydrogenase maturation protein HypF